MAESDKKHSSLQANNEEVARRREEQFLNSFQKPVENNTIYIDVLNHLQKGRFPRFNERSKILSCHLHEELNIPAKSWKFVNLNISIKLPDQYVYTLSYLTSFLASKGLSIVPINLRTGEIVRLIVEVHNISNTNLRIHSDSTFYEIRFMTHYNVMLKKWSDSSIYSAKTQIKYPIQAEETREEAAV